MTDEEKEIANQERELLEKAAERFLREDLGLTITMKVRSLWTCTEGGKRVVVAVRTSRNRRVGYGKGFHHANMVVFSTFQRRNKSMADVYQFATQIPTMVKQFEKAKRETLARTFLAIDPVREEHPRGNAPESDGNLRALADRQREIPLVDSEPVSQPNQHADIWAALSEHLHVPIEKISGFSVTISR